MTGTFRWEAPEYIVLGIVSAVLSILVIFFYEKWRKGINKNFKSESRDKLISRKYKFEQTYWLWVLIPLLFGLALANPQWGQEKETKTVRGTDIMIALDISSSMLAADVVPSRMERAKHFSTGLIDRLYGNRIGLILFAGGAIKQSPLTTDYKILKTMIHAASPAQAAAQGTNIRDAVKLSQMKSNEKEETAKALLIITDGEMHDEAALEEVTKAASKGTLIFVVGVGTETGGPIPDPGNPFQKYKRDEQGNEVITRLNTDMCRKLAHAGGGKAYVLNNLEVVIDNIMDEMNNLELREIETVNYQKYNSFFFVFVLIALMLLVILSFKTRMV